MKPSIELLPPSFKRLMVKTIALGTVGFMIGAGAPITHRVLLKEGIIRPKFLTFGARVPQAQVAPLTVKGLTSPTPSVDVGDTHGYPTIINVWATWCGPCKTEYPMFERILNEQPSLKLISVAYQDAPVAVQAFVEKNGGKLDRTYLATDTFSKRLGVKGVPLTIAIDSRGFVRGIVQGGPVTELQLKSLISKAKM